MTERIIISGAGGQGVMLLGKVLALAAMQEEKCVSWLPAYGAEVRGGAAFCMTTISDAEIGSPFIELADTLIVMNGLSWQRFHDRLKKNGLLLLNTSLVDCRPKVGLQLEAHPFTDIAIRLGRVQVANMVILGCLLAKTRLVAVESVLKVMEDMVKGKNNKELLEINKKALKAGRDLVKG